MTTQQVFTLPDLGEGLTEATLVSWLVKVGDTVAVDEPIAEVETAKATVEVPSPYAGTVAELHGEPGATIPVGAPLITVTALDAYTEEERAGSGNVLIGYGTPAEAPPGRRRRRRAAAAAERAVPDAAAPEPAVPDTAPTHATAPAPAAQAPAAPTPAAPTPVALPQAVPAVVSPIVRQLARRAGLDLAALPGTGPDGLVTRSDVERAIAAPQVTSTSTRPEPGPDPDSVAAPVAAPVAAAGQDGRTGLPIADRTPLTGIRGHIAETLARSRREIPEATTWVDVDATALLALRADMRDGDWKPGLLALLARFVLAGLARFPELNSRVDTERGEVLQLDGVNLGIAAQGARGLVVPAIRGAHRLSIRGLDAEIRRLSAAAREGTATAAELSSGSFTLNNYGVFGVDGSAAIINHPEAAILGIGRILPRPWVVDGEIVPRQITQLSLVFDHRVCDGGTAGGFLRFVADAVEAPLRALADL